MRVYIFISFNNKIYKFLWDNNKKKKNAKYPFAIFNADKHNKPGKHWQSFMDIHPKKTLLLFDSLGLDGFKFFVVKTMKAL